MRSREYVALGALVLIAAVIAVLDLALKLQSPQWLTALATLALVVAAFLAIAKEQVQGWLFHPTLEILPEFYHHETHLNRGQQAEPNEPNAYYIVFQVMNTGKCPARNVEVSIKSVVHTEPEKAQQPHRMLTPFNMKWAYVGQATMALIPIDSSRPMALGHITKPAHGADVGEPPAEGLSLFWLELFVRPNNMECALRPGSYDIKLHVSADNARPRDYVVHLYFTGKWHDDTDQIWPQELEASVERVRSV